MELYVPEAIAENIISIANSFNIDAQIVGSVEAADKKQLTIRSDKGEFVYHN